MFGDGRVVRTVQAQEHNTDSEAWWWEHHAMVQLLITEGNMNRCTGIYSMGGEFNLMGRESKPGEKMDISAKE